MVLYCGVRIMKEKRNTFKLQKKVIQVISGVSNCTLRRQILAFKYYNTLMLYSLYILEVIYFIKKQKYFITKNCISIIITHDIGQGESRHRKFKRLKLGGGQVYDRSSV
jgi:hypothetical protein